MKSTIPEIAAQMTAMILSANIYTTRSLKQPLSAIEKNLTNSYEYGRTFGGISLLFSQAWGVEATLYIDVDAQEVTRRDRQYKVLRLNVELNYPSSSSDIPTTNAKIALMRQVTDLASLIHASFDGVEIETAPKS